MGLHPLPMNRRVAMAHKANPQVCPRKRRNEVCMRKTFSLQVWQTAGLILGTPRSRATSNLHAGAFTAYRDANVADDMLFPRQRQPTPGHSLPTLCASQSPCFTRPGNYASPVRKESKAVQRPQTPPASASSGAPAGSTAVAARLLTGRQMQHKNPAQTVKCVKIYTNASFLYVRSTL